MSLHIIVADDHITVRLGARYIINEWMPEAIVSFAENMPELLRLLSSGTPANVVILDINIPGGNSFHMIEMIKNIQKEVHIVMLSAYDELTYALRYIDSGADGYVHKNGEDQEITEALNTVMQGRKYLSKGMRDYLVERRFQNSETAANNPMALLGDRELEVTGLLAEGKGVGEIAKTLHIHTSTVGTYKGKIFKKLGVANIKELIDLFRQHGVHVK